jgi:hypothetical protein
MPIGLPTVPLKKQKNHAIRAKVDPDLPALSRTPRDRKSSPRAVFAALEWGGASLRATETVPGGPRLRRRAHRAARVR